MVEVTSNIEDLEDGEIESDGEDVAVVPKEEKSEETTAATEEKSEKLQEEYRYSKSGKKKKSKSHKGEQKSKDKKKSRKYGSQTEDDFAGNIEKAIRKAMNKNEGDNSLDEGMDERKKSKKRKKYDNKDAPSKKRKKQEFNDEMDESEMMCVRGASPVQHHSPGNMYEDDRDSYASDTSNDSRGHFHNRPQRRRPSRERNNKSNNNKNERRRGGGAHPMQDPDGVCLYYMQGKCHKGDDCIYSHDAQPPRKMELCKFYLMDCCAKRDKCLYMHADFPCKYYHTGLPCIYKEECKFAHGMPLNEGLRNILLKHIESAPKEILGDFPRLSREGALKMIQATQTKLMQQYPESMEKQDKTIPSLFEINIPPPNSIQLEIPNYTNQYDKSKNSPKIRHSRWQNDNGNQNYNANLSPNSNSGNTNVLNIKNLTGVLTPRQISDLSKMGIENLEQLGQLTVLQLNSIGISLKQITEIQLNTMSIQKLGLIGSNNESQTFYNPSGNTMDLDLRVPPIVPVSSTAAISTDLLVKDIDMRFQPPAATTASQENRNIQGLATTKDMIDIDQYTKDALKFASKDKENIDMSNDAYDNDKPTISNETKDVDHRVLSFCDESSSMLQPAPVTNNTKSKGDTDIRFLQPEPIFKNPEKRNRRSTTDDEDNNLLIDEKWYSSDEEKCNKKSKSPSASPQPASISSHIPAPHVIEPPTNILSKLGDLSKFDISEEVTKLLNTMKNNLHENKNEPATPESDSQRSRDPRSKRSPEKASDPPKADRKPKISIYECVDGEPTDGRRRSDVDLRSSMPSFGDTDLRQSTSGDIDLRLGLPFKAIPNYTPASEIDGSINSHPPIPYKLVHIQIPRPDYTAIRDSTAKSQALVDPRLRKVFRLSVEESSSDSEKPVKAAASTAAAPRVDPRRKPKDIENTVSHEQKTNSPDLQTILQNSSWYKELSTTQKIFVNQNLAPVTQILKQYQTERGTGKKFDLTPIQSNSILCSIFSNLGVTIGEFGEFSHVPKPKEALLKTPVGFNPPTNPFMGMEGNNMNMMNMPPMGMGGVNNMHGYNQSFPDRGGPAPGLLGIAPNMPHNYNNNFNGPNNYQNMGFNGPNGGPGNDFNYMDGDQNYQRFPNRGGHRGRGNDRWNRGGSGRGPRRNDRGNWKGDRH